MRAPRGQYNKLQKSEYNIIVCSKALGEDLHRAHGEDYKGMSKFMVFPPLLPLHCLSNHSPKQNRLYSPQPNRSKKANMFLAFFTFSVPSMRSHSVSSQSVGCANEWDTIWDKGKPWCSGQCM